MRPGSPQADIDRALRNIKDRMTGGVEYEWVESHQDDLLLWEELTNEQQLNVLCDTLAKGAVTRATRQESRAVETQLLPGEKGAVIIDGTKLISDASDAIRYSLNRVEAERYYTLEMG